MKKNLLIFLIFLTANSFLKPQIDLPDSPTSQEQLLENLLSTFSSEDQKVILAEADRIEKHLESLPPEEREIEEMKMIEEADKAWQQIFEEADRQQKTVEIKKEVPQIEPIKKEEPKKVEVDTKTQKAIESIEDALEAIVDSLSSYILKVQSLPRVSSKTYFEDAWPKKEEEIVYAKAIFAGSKKSKNVLKELATDENKSKADSIKSLSKKLSSKESALNIPDTARLKKDPTGKDECSEEQVKTAQDKVEEIADLLKEFFKEGIVKELRETFKKVSPEDLKRIEKKSPPPSNYEGRSGSAQPSYNKVTRSSGTGYANRGGYYTGGYDSYYDDDYLYTYNKNTQPKLEEEKSKEKAEDKKPELKEKAPQTPEQKKPNKDFKLTSKFKQSISKVDKKLNEINLASKFKELEAADKKRSEEIERELISPVSEINLELDTAVKSANKIVSKNSALKPIVKDFFKNTSIYKLNNLKDSLKKIEAKGFIDKDNLDEISWLINRQEKIEKTFGSRSTGK